VRKCGELEGVIPLDPIVLGHYPIELARDETGSCPMFAPVPCTKPLSEYASVCGAECVPQTAEGSDGDTWLVGCARSTRGMGCSGPDFHLVQCSHDPYEGEAFWFEIFECRPPFVPLWFCWPTCDDGETINEPLAWCP
jgi:hypothetical protein